MSIEKNKELLYRWNVDGWGKGDLDAIDEVFAPNRIVHWNDFGPTDQQRAPDVVKKMITIFREAMPDFHGTVDQLVAEGDMVAFHVIWEGTHTGTFKRGSQEFPPTKQALVLDGHAHRPDRERESRRVDMLVEVRH